MLRIAVLLLAGATVVSAQEEATSLPPATCRAAESMDVWLGKAKTDKLAKLSDDLKEQVAKLQGRLEALCSSEPADEAFADGSAAPWLRQIDETIMLMSSAVSAALEQPLSAKARQYVHAVSFWQVSLDAVAMEKRAQAYAAVRVETKEVVRTIPVPAQCPRCPDLVCPDVPTCPQGPDPFEVAEERRRERERDCSQTLRSALREWENRLNTNYPAAREEYGSAYLAAGDINNQISRCSMGFSNSCGDLHSTVVGWERGLAGIIASNGRGGGSMAPTVLQRVISLQSAMNAKLDVCERGRRR